MSAVKTMVRWANKSDNGAQEEIWNERKSVRLALMNGCCVGFFLSCLERHANTPTTAAAEESAPIAFPRRKTRGYKSDTPHSHIK